MGSVGWFPGPEEPPWEEPSLAFIIDLRTPLRVGGHQPRRVGSQGALPPWRPPADPVARARPSSHPAPLHPHTDRNPVGRTCLQRVVTCLEVSGSPGHAGLSPACPCPCPSCSELGENPEVVILWVLLRLACAPPAWQAAFRRAGLPPHRVQPAPTAALGAASEAPGGKGPWAGRGALWACVSAPG